MLRMDIIRNNLDESYSSKRFYKKKKNNSEQKLPSPKNCTPLKFYPASTLLPCTVRAL